MTKSSLSKQLARYTKPLRVSLGLAHEDRRRDAEPPFNRTRASTTLPGGRLRSVENDLDRLIGGWNQHLPQILAAVSEARQSARQAASHEDIAELQLSIRRLTAIVTDLSARIDHLDPTLVENRPRSGAEPKAESTLTTGATIMSKRPA